MTQQERIRIELTRVQADWLERGVDVTSCDWLPAVEPISIAFAVVGGLFAIAWALRGIFG